jgi:hypothetical protein
VAAVLKRLDELGAASSPVITATTPGSASAALLSIERGLPGYKQSNT